MAELNGAERRSGWASASGSGSGSGKVYESMNGGGCNCEVWKPSSAPRAASVISSVILSVTENANEIADVEGERNVAEVVLAVISHPDEEQYSMVCPMNPVAHQTAEGWVPPEEELLRQEEWSLPL